ncbi:hypothetical protein N7495_006989 [Penicillium taxi]|uniref:uncharacterized protein n=1 Tax=Penicillium taxi TaxID=168475 RepID=UPI0025452B7D|nr:uncharacterized protein N7495_006989 [Penicillium taxi]KAJ5895298.1 hypothetical protein N7495_006989 [Penicillium taxi]
MSNASIVIPRPGTVNFDSNVQSIQAPPETSFVATFGQLLPPVSYFQTPNGRAAYYKLPYEAPKSAGTGPISRVLYVHGVQTPAIGLQPLASALSSRFPHAQCVLIDLWGHGLTDTPITPHDAALFHGLLEALMVHLQWENAHFVGYSFGGSTTATFAAKYPERVASMVLCAPAGLYRSVKFGEKELSYLRGGEGLEEEARDWIWELLEGGKLVVPSDWKERVDHGEVVAAAVKDWLLREHKGYLASVVGIWRDGGVLDRHAQFKEAAKKGIPNLCILGELDGVCSVQDLSEVGMHNVTVVPQVGHPLVRERVPEVSRLIEDFWTKL